MSIKKLIRASLIGVFGLSALMMQAVEVPAEWNVDPWTNGVSFEAFENLPGWATGQQVQTGAPARSDRFWTDTVAVGKQLVFSTLGITNTISGAKIQPGVPVFADLRCKIYSFGSTPPTLATNTVLCFYANQNSNLVVASSTECKTNTAIKIESTEYYPVMIRFATDAFDVFFTNSTVPVISLIPTTNQIARLVIAGDGGMDDLYLSYGDPRRLAYTNAIALSAWTPSSAEEKVVSNWVASQKAAGASVTTITKDNAVGYYLTGTTPSDNNFTGELGIGSIAYNPASTSVTVVVTLKTDNSTRKTGKINGLLKLKGASSYDNAKSGSWSAVLATTTIQSEDFANGVATYTFRLPTADNKFFLPVIQSNIQ
jgi:hypothetical protein